MQVLRVEPGAESDASLPAVDSDDWDFYHILLLDSCENPTKFLLFVDDEVENFRLSLPYFEFDIVHTSGITVPRVCERFRSWLGITNDDVFFTGSVELLGYRIGDSRRDPEKQGRAQLLHVEAHGIEPCEIELPIGAEWKDGSLLETMFLDRTEALVGFIVSAIEACFDESREFLATLSDERYRPGWFESAIKFLVESAVRDGAEVEDRVVQDRMALRSTMLKVRTSLGSYYLKSPVCGCNETKTTAIISKLFPKHCPDIVGVCEEFNCFVSREFDWEAENSTRDAVMLLGKLQMESIQHIDVLREAGCPSWDLTKIVETSSNWDEMWHEVELHSGWFEDLPGKLAELCEELKEFKIPMTLVHGDFFLNNYAQALRDRGRDLVIFDWEFAYIGHPFFDFHRIHNYVPEKVREEYLQLWTNYEGIDRLRRAYRVARDIGWAMKACLVLEWSKETMARGSAQDPTFLGDSAFSFAQALRSLRL